MKSNSDLNEPLKDWLNNFKMYIRKDSIEEANFSILISENEMHMESSSLDFNSYSSYLRGHE